MRISSADLTPQQEDGEKRCLNSELWHACAGPLVSLPAVGSRVVYFPQGHSEQVANSTNKEVDAQTPNYPSLPPQLVCQLHDVTMHADVETDEVYAQMTLQPLGPQEHKEIYLPAELGAPSKQPTNYFCKTLTASDTSTHGGFSVPRRAAEKVFPPLDFSQQPPAQELIARDLHDNEWKFRHIFRGQPKRHLLTTGWSVFVSAKRLVAGDSVLFIWNDKNQLLLGIRRANRAQTVIPSSVLSSDSMHLGLLAAAAHAASTNSRFSIFYNPRASPSDFVIPLAKYVKAVYHTRVSIGMRFRMMFETEESSVRRYMGTITGISDLDPARWPNSHWRSVKVGWDESTAGEMQPRVSLWEVEPLTTLPMYPSPFSLGLKRPWPSGIRDNLVMSRLAWLQGDNNEHRLQALKFPGAGLTPYMQPTPDFSMLGFPNDMYQILAAAALQDPRSLDPSRLASSSYLPFHQPQAVPMPMSLIHGQSPPQHSSHENGQGNQPSLKAEATSQAISQSFLQQQSHFMRQQQQFNSFTSFSPQSHIPGPGPNPVCSTVKPSAQSVQTAFSSPLGDLPPHPLNLTKDDDVSSASWLHKRARHEPALLPDGVINPSIPNSTEDPFSLPPFPGRECPLDPDGTACLQDNLMFGVNADSSSVFMQDGIKPGGDVNLPFSSPDFVGTSIAADYAAHPPDNISQKPPTRNFVKVYKSGSYGRSLDLAKFSCYQELRNELARMFGLEGELEDPQRSGWQLVFVDKEDDVLLLGDGPWMEFVNSVWCIKILSLQEVQEMDPQGLELLGSVPGQRLSNGAFEDYLGIQDPRSMNSSVPAVGSLQY